MIDDNASNVKSLSTGVVVNPLGVVCASYKKTVPPVKTILSLVGFSALK